MPFKDISYLELLVPPYLTERNHLGIFAIGHYRNISVKLF